MNDATSDDASDGRGTRLIPSAYRRGSRATLSRQCSRGIGAAGGYRSRACGLRDRDPSIRRQQRVGSGRRFRTCRIAVNSRAPSPRWTDRNKEDRRTPTSVRGRSGSYPGPCARTARPERDLMYTQPLRRTGADSPSPKDGGAAGYRSRSTGLPARLLSLQTAPIGCTISNKHGIDTFREHEKVNRESKHRLDHLD